MTYLVMATQLTSRSCCRTGQEGKRAAHSAFSKQAGNRSSKRYAIELLTCKPHRMHTDSASGNQGFIVTVLPQIMTRPFAAFATHHDAHKRAFPDHSNASTQKNPHGFTPTGIFFRLLAQQTRSNVSAG
ncbi:MAG TPA: hypothetical protein VGM85_00105 [Paraburkholderia sp.]|jgi:hypothetical protein